jgi:hypothetical protein
MNVDQVIVFLRPGGFHIWQHALQITTIQILTGKENLYGLLNGKTGRMAN